MSDVKMGGKPNLAILAIGGQELTDLVAGRNEGGTKLAKGLAERAAAQFGQVKVEVTSQPGATFAALANWVAPPNAPDIVLVSTQSEVMGAGRLDIKKLHEDGKKAMKALKDAGAHVVVVNVATVEPNDTVSNYFGLESDTPALRAHKVALTLIDLSAEQGISIIDADRLLAEMGAERHVESVGRYSAEASEVVCEEILRVLADYGFFEQRPLVVQAGRGGS